jgi:hypothetical protein
MGVAEFEDKLFFITLQLPLSSQNQEGNVINSTDMKHHMVFISIGY